VCNSTREIRLSTVASAGTECDGDSASWMSKNKVLNDKSLVLNTTDRVNPDCRN